MDKEKSLARKEENLEKLIRSKDEAIRREMLSYEEAEYYIRLQSECFNLFPVVVKALSLLIADDKSRAVFCSIVKGHKLERLAAYHNLTPQEAVQTFRSAVSEIRQRIAKGAFTAKESVNIRLMHERNELKDRVRNCDIRYKKAQQTIDELLEQLTLLFDEKEKNTTDGFTGMLEKELAVKESTLREKIRKELQQEMRRQAEEQAAKDARPGSVIVRWIQRIKLKCLRVLYFFL